MKLYATTTSERASKGQGGNQYLDIVIRNEDSEIIALIGFYPDGSGYISVLKDMKFAIKRPHAIERPLSWDELKQKGEKKKGEKTGCEYCDANGGYPCSNHDGSRFE